jgi:hypothetical protein
MQEKTKYYLYLKESPNGLKYLGKTIKDPYQYSGSGIVWRRHLKKYGFSNDDIQTTVLFETTSKEELKEMGAFFSETLDIVKNKVFANLIVEEGQGGKTLYSENHPCWDFKERIREYWTYEKRKEQSEKMKFDNPSKKEYVKEKLKQSASGRKFSDEVNKKKGKVGDNNVSKREDVRLKISNGLKGRKLSQETKDKISKTLKQKKWL